MTATEDEKAMALEAFDKCKSTLLNGSVQSYLIPLQHVDTIRKALAPAPVAGEYVCSYCESSKHDFGCPVQAATSQQAREMEPKKSDDFGSGWDMAMDWCVSQGLLKDDAEIPRHTAQQAIKEITDLKKIMAAIELADKFFNQSAGFKTEMAYDRKAFDAFMKRHELMQEEVQKAVADALAAHKVIKLKGE